MASNILLLHIKKWKFIYLVSPIQCKALKFKQGASTMCILVVEIFSRVFFFLNKIDICLGNGFSVYEKLIIREQIPFSLLPFNSKMHIPYQSETDMLSQVSINGNVHRALHII